MGIDHRWNVADEENEVCPIAILSTKNPTRIDSISNPGPRCLGNMGKQN
jgi:hypothetical protein